MPASRSRCHDDPDRVVQRADVALDHPAEAVAVLGGLVHHDLVELGVGGGEADEPPDRLGERRGQLGGIVGAGGQRQVGQLVAEPAEEVVDRRGPQRLLRGEVVVDLGLVGVDALGDRPGRRAVESLGAELDERRLEQLLADVVSGPAHGTPMLSSDNMRDPATGGRAVHAAHRPRHAPVRAADVRPHPPHLRLRDRPPRRRPGDVDRVLRADRQRRAAGVDHARPRQGQGGRPATARPACACSTSAGRSATCRSTATPSSTTTPTSWST